MRLTRRGPSQTELAWAADRLENVDGIQTVLESCPADIKGPRKTWRHWLFFNRNAWSFSNCNANIETCLRACTDNLDGSACRAVGRVFEKFGGPEYDFNRRQGYALACALGNASGRTNRGASIRNSKTKVDVLTQSDPEKLALCQTRTFAAACSDGDAWGCAMEGQSTSFWGGRARRFYQSAGRNLLRLAHCTVAPKRKIQMRRRADLRGD